MKKEEERGERREERYSVEMILFSMITKFSLIVSIKSIG
jgi:hypothetical protein